MAHIEKYSIYELTVNNAGFLISEEDLASDRDQGLITKELLCSKVLLRYEKKKQRKLLTKTSEGGMESATSLVLARQL